MIRQTKNKGRAEVGTSNAANPPILDAIEAVDPTELCNMFAFDPQRMLAMERMLHEVVQKNQELENANVQLHSWVFELESNQNQNQVEHVAAAAATQKAIGEAPGSAVENMKKSPPNR